MRQCINKSYEDSEKDGFIHRNTNTDKSKTQKIDATFADVNNPIVKNDTENNQNSDTVKWSKKDKQNMRYAISTIGYDPFEDVGLTDSDR